MVSVRASYEKNQTDLTAITHSPMGRGLYVPPPALVFCPLFKISLGNPYLKLFADTPMKKNLEIQFYPISEHYKIWV